LLVSSDPNHHIWHFVDKIAEMNFGAQSVMATRFAPSPNGRLHVGHAYSALCAHDFARRFGGAFHLRIEDIDGTRSRAEHVEAIIADMAWLGLAYDGPVHYQSQNIARYAEALDQLQAMGLVYRCWCTRSDIAEALKQRPVRHGPDGPVYPGTCRGKKGSGLHCWRLDMAAAMARVQDCGWIDLAAGPQTGDAAQFGDVVLWRKDAPASYHLASVLDDAVDGISHIVRGMDLFAYTAIHRVLQQLLDLPQPMYWHHPLLLDEKGEKLAKSRFSQPLSDLRAQGVDGAALVADLRRGRLPLGISTAAS
jgi:glutamyl-Q tRNA(Asp) synthetase